MPFVRPAHALAIASFLFVSVPSDLIAEPRDNKLTFPPIPGALDPATGFFMPQAVAPESTRAPQSRFGQFNVVATISLQPSIDANAPITCYFQLQHSGHAYSQEVGRVRGTRNGNIGSCQIAIPYNWVQVNPAVQVRLLYSIAAGTYELRHRESSGNRGLPLPAQGAVTPISLAIRL